MAAAMVRPSRNVKTGRFRARHESGSEETVRLDWTKDVSENVKEILRHIVQQNNINKGKKLGYLNCFVKLIHKYGKEKELGVSNSEILICLRVGLLHEAKEVRAATLRVMRHLLILSDVVDTLLYLNIDYLVARSLDICIDNEIERVHAIKLIRKISQLYPNKLCSSLLNPVIAVANDGASERDRLLRVCLASVCEIAFQNTPVLHTCGGVSALLRNILACHQYPRLNESLVSTILYLLNHPRTRHFIKANSDLEQLLAPFTDCHFKQSYDSEHSGSSQELRFGASKMALITVMRSWPGLIRLCHPEGSGLQSLIGILYLPYTEIRKSILELIFDLFRLSLPTWTNEFATALLSVDPSEMQEQWKLTEGFVAEEGRSIIPHMAKSRPNLVENHLALILSAWIHGGILEALVEVIGSTEGPLFVRAVILVGELLHMANHLLPVNCSNHSHCLPTLISMASSFDIPSAKRHQASLAVTYLSHFHAMKKRGAVPCSLYMDQLLQHAGKFLEYNGRHWHLRRDKLAEKYFTKALSDELLSQAIRDSQVLLTKDNMNWDWDLIVALLKWPDEKLRKLDDQYFTRVLRRLVYFYKPTNDLFSRMDQSHEHSRKLTDIGCHLIDFLIKSNQEEAQKYISDWLSDIAQCLSEISSHHSAPEAVLSLSSIHTSLSQYYFLFIGRFSLTPRGDRYLEKLAIYQHLLELMSANTQELYIKLTISSLNYSRDGMARAILSKALTSGNEGTRVYATKLLRVLLRTGVPGFQHWGMELLVTQLYDQSQSIAMSAINILDEACDAPVNLISLVKLRPTFLHLGHRGVMMLCRFLSTPKGFKSLMDANFVNNELQRWHKTYNLRYVNIVEELLDEALTTYEKTYQGQFTRRSIQKRPKKDVFLPVHLYGQLCQHEDGLDLLRKEECLKEYFQHIHSLELLTDDDIFKLKTALWAVGHVGTSCIGMSWLEDEEVVPEIIRLAEECGVFSIRGTAFYVLGLFASTFKGTSLLARYGWESLCHTRTEQWPVSLEEGYFPVSVPSSGSASNLSLLSAFKPEADRSSVSGNSHLSFIQEEGKADSSNQSFSCDKSETQSVKSVSNIPHEKLLSANGHSTGNFTKSQTLPYSSGDFDRYQHLHVRSPLAISQSQPVVRVRASSDDHDVYSRTEQLSTETSVMETFSVSYGDKNVISGERFLTVQTDSERLETASDPGLPDMGEEKVKDKEIVFKIGGSNILRDDRSSSEGSHRSKSRTNSFNTDSTTSGVSSCESGALTTGLVVSSLSPIASTSSLNTIASSQISTQHDAREPVHPSSAQRRLAKLTRIPSLRRRSAAPALGIFPSSHSSDTGFTSHRDVVGYATLRIIKRIRTYSSEGEDAGLGSVFGDARITRAQSTESDTSVDSNIWMNSIRRNISSASLPDFDGGQSSPYNTLNRPLFLAPPVAANFVGLCLPVDVSMVFEVIEGEDQRSSVFTCPNDNGETSKNHPEEKYNLDVPPLKPEVSCQHSADVCIVCVVQKALRKSSSQDPLYNDDLPAIDSEADGTQKDMADVTGPGLKMGRPRTESVNENSSATPGSTTSNNSSDLASKKLTEETASGRNLIKQEIMKLIVNLGSSVGAKGTEQSLLGLKQKFPKAFFDLCFYSEVCHLLASYAFRLDARRFVQELFDELNLASLLEEPQRLLSVAEPEEQEESYKRMTSLHQSNLDPFPESNA